MKYLTDNIAEERRAMIQAVRGKQTVANVFSQNFSAADFGGGDAEVTTLQSI